MGPSSLISTKPMSEEELKLKGVYSSINRQVNSGSQDSVRVVEHLLTTHPLLNSEFKELVKTWTELLSALYSPKPGKNSIITEKKSWELEEEINVKAAELIKQIQSQLQNSSCSPS